MAEYKRAESLGRGALYEEVTVIEPYTGSIGEWAGEALRRKEAEPERRFALLFNDTYVEVKDGDDVNSVYRRWDDEREMRRVGWTARKKSE